MHALLGSPRSDEKGCLYGRVIPSQRLGDLSVSDDFCQKPSDGRILFPSTRRVSQGVSVLIRRGETEEGVVHNAQHEGKSRLSATIQFMTLRKPSFHWPIPNLSYARNGLRNTDIGEGSEVVSIGLRHPPDIKRE